METDGRKKPSLVKEVLLTGLTIATLGAFHHNITTTLEEEQRSKEQISQEASGKIAQIETPSSDELKLAKNYAKKFLTYNEEKVDSSLILERIKGDYSKIIYIDKSGTRVIKLDSINPELVKSTLELSDRFNVNPKLMLTLAIIESKFGTDKKMISTAGAKGEFQVMPKVIKEYKKKHKLKNPLIESAFLLIKDYGKALGINVSYNSNLSQEEITLITAAYNAGITNLKNKSEKIFIDQNWFSETKNYSLYALSALNHYRYDTGLKDDKGNSILV